MTTVCFDVDGTLIWQEGTRGVPDTPRYEVIALLLQFESFGYDIFIWSGGGIDYAERWAMKLGLERFLVRAKGNFLPDIAVDDEAVNLGVVNLRV